MKLFEITNGWTGESYIRVYVWAGSEHQAVSMANTRLGYAYRDSDLQVTELFDASAGPFVTAPSDCGWEVDCEHVWVGMTTPLRREYCAKCKMARSEWKKL